MDCLKKILIVEFNNIDWESSSIVFITTSEEEAVEFMRENTSYCKDNVTWYWSTNWAYIGVDSEQMSDSEYDFTVYHFTGEKAKDWREIEKLFNEKRKNFVSKNKFKSLKTKNIQDKVLVVAFMPAEYDSYEIYFFALSEENAKKYMTDNIDIIHSCSYDAYCWVTYYQNLNEPLPTSINDKELNYFHFNGKKAKDLDEIKNCYSDYYYNFTGEKPNNSCKIKGCCFNKEN